MAGPHLKTKAERQKFALLLRYTARMVEDGELRAVYLGVSNAGESMTFQGFTHVRAMDELGTIIAADAEDQGWIPPWG